MPIFHVLIFFLFFSLSLTGKEMNRPNIIFILTDDQRWDALGVAGNAIIKTPQMDELAKKGIYFKNAFSTTPICAASRASILTGLYERTHTYTFQKPALQKPYSRLIYPKLLKEKGYHVGFFGKLGVVMDKPAQYFNESDFYDRGPRTDKGGYFYKQIGNDTVHLTRYTGQQAQDFIANAPKNKPFCLSLSFSAPHGHDSSVEQYFWQKKSDTLYENMVFPEPNLGADLYFDRLPIEVKNGFNRVRWKWRFDTPEKYQRMMRGYYRMITEIDDEIGSLRNLLTKKGLADNTIFIIMGDNGYFTGDRQLADKWLMYDPSIRIPLMIYDPGMPSGMARTVSDMVLNIDITKTILDVAGIKSPANYQGESLKPFLKKADYSLRRDFILMEHLWKLPEIPSSEGIRTAKWKYFKYRFIQAPEELYDLENDPMETKNLAMEQSHQKILKNLRNQFTRKAQQLIDDRLVEEAASQAQLKF
jgi:arylsulfatase A-like enzyme